ncbi:MAG: phage tail tube protein [Blastomonas sp.]
MTNPHKVTGQSRITADGEVLPTDGSSTLEPGGVTRESVIGDYDASSFRETPAPSKLECTLLVKRGRSITSIQAIDNATVVTEADTGQTWIMRNAYVAEAVSLSTSEGKVRVVFMGPPAEELVQ